MERRAMLRAALLFFAVLVAWLVSGLAAPGFDDPAATDPQPPAAVVGNPPDTDRDAPNGRGDESIRRGAGAEPAAAAGGAVRLTAGANAAGAPCSNVPTASFRPGKCPADHQWLLPWAAARGAGARWTLVDVGANKGYVIAGWLDMLLRRPVARRGAGGGGRAAPGEASGPVDGLSEQLGAAIFATHGAAIRRRQAGRQAPQGGGFISLCGGCCECTEAPPAKAADSFPGTEPENVRVIGFEPSRANHEWLVSFFHGPNASVATAATAAGDPTGAVAAAGPVARIDGGERRLPRATVDIRHAAVGAAASTSYFPDVPFGTEIGRVLPDPQPGYHAVQVVTLDAALATAGPIDVLATDAEGFDQFVAAGAERLLSTGRVSFYQFEMAAAVNYTAVFRRLEGWGFDCYFPTKARVKGRARLHRVPEALPITGACWRPEFERFSGWMNALCAHRSVPVLRDIFVRLAKTPHLRRGSGPCDGRAKQIRRVSRFLGDRRLN